MQVLWLDSVDSALRAFESVLVVREAEIKNLGDERAYYYLVVFRARMFSSIIASQFCKVSEGHSLWVNVLSTRILEDKVVCKPFISIDN